MARRRFFWQLYALFLALTFVVFVTASEFATQGFKKFYYAQTAGDLASRAKLAAELIATMPGDPEKDVDAFCKRIGLEAGIRLTVIRPDGVVVADTDADPRTMDNHGHRPEVVEAFAGRDGSLIRFSETTHEERMYVAVPLKRAGAVTEVVRTSITTEPLLKTLGAFRRKLALTAGGLSILLFLSVIGFLQKINKPLEAMRHGALRFAGGELDFRLPAPPYEELSALAGSLNSMAGQLQSRLETISRQRDEMQAVLGSMREAVIAVDAGEHILQMNTAASELAGAQGKPPVGQMLAGVIRNTELLRLLRTALERREAAESEIILHRGDEAERTVQVNATPLRDATGAVLGAVIVANDITNLRRLERVRRDFVANVSHELKTPLTSIKGFVETLEEGALDQPDEARRFVGIIARQVSRLQAVLDDLLSLSRIEQQAERGELRFQDDEIRPVLEAAVELCSHRAALKRIALTVNCPAGARTRMNVALLEQAAVNLIENGIKYSEPGRAIRVAVAPEGGGWKIDFADEGCGIESQHLDRIFERFYRVDKSRSRGEGGTGLGLSIVKHIMAAHNGSVTVVSTPGSGSTFTLHLPA